MVRITPAVLTCPQAVGAACGHTAFGELRELLQASLEDDVRSNKNTFLNRWGMIQRRKGAGPRSAITLAGQGVQQAPHGTQPACFPGAVAHAPPPLLLPAWRRTQQCFALKSGVDGFLDVARQTFCRVTEQARLHTWRGQAEGAAGACSDALPDVPPCYLGGRPYQMAATLPPPTSGARAGQPAAAAARPGRHALQLHQQEGESRERDIACCDWAGAAPALPRMPTTA